MHLIFDPVPVDERIYHIIYIIVQVVSIAGSLLQLVP